MTTRRGFLGLLAAAPIAAPLIAKEATAASYASGGYVRGLPFWGSSVGSPVIEIDTSRPKAFLDAATNRYAKWQEPTQALVDRMRFEPSWENEMHSTTAREVIQHIDDIEIPTIEITEGWAADSVATRKDCDDAFAYLMSACAGIEFQIDVELTKPKNFQDVMWMAKARCALKYKKAALQIVQQRRSVIAEAERRIWQDSRDRKLLEYIRSVVPNQQFMNWLQGSGTVATLESDAAA